MTRIKNNKGFSLVELIIVIAILSALTAVTSLSINTIGRSKTMSVIEEVDTMLSRCKAENLSGLNCYVQFETGSVELCKKAADGTVTVLESRELEDSVTLTTEPESASKVVSFDMATGALDSDCEKIVATGGLTTYTIVLESLTGSHTIQ